MTRSSRVTVLVAWGALLPLAAGAAVGTGTYSHHIGCSGSSLTYSVDAGPANTCGALYTVRNGSLLTTGIGWLCTDANGDATNGPWTWANTPGDQTDVDTRIVWPNSTQTTLDWHIWDKTCPTVDITSASGNPPSAFSGTAADTTYGSGFRSNCVDSPWTSASYVYAIYKDVTNNRYWSPATGIYSSTTLTSANVIYGTISGMPSQNVTWSVTVPTAGAHVAGNSYEWRACVSDCCCSSCDYLTFP